MTAKETLFFFLNMLYSGQMIEWEAVFLFSQDDLIFFFKEWIQGLSPNQEPDCLLHHHKRGSRHLFPFYSLTCKSGQCRTHFTTSGSAWQEKQSLCPQHNHLYCERRKSAPPKQEFALGLLTSQINRDLWGSLPSLHSFKISTVPQGRKNGEDSKAVWRRVMGSCSDSS